MSEDEVVFIDELPVIKRDKYSSRLAAIKAASQKMPIPQWALLEKFEKAATAKDLAVRMKKVHGDKGFKFTSRSMDDQTGVTYALWTGEEK